MKDRRTLAWLALAGLVICYGRVLSRMAEQWAHDEDMGHGFVVPLAMALVVWKERGAWGPAVGAGAGSGWGLLTLGVLLHWAGVMGAGLFASALGLVVTGTGLVVVLGGWRLLRAWGFVLGLSLFLLPKFALLYNAVSGPLQLVASELAARGLALVGLGVLREGNLLTVRGHTVAVAEACNGIRYLLPLLFLSLVWGRMAGRRGWRLALIGLSAAPVAVVANAVRVAASAADPRLVEGTPHALLGLVLFLGCLTAVGLLISRLRESAR